MHKTFALLAAILLLPACATNHKMTFGECVGKTHQVVHEVVQERVDKIHNSLEGNTLTAAEKTRIDRAMHFMNDVLSADINRFCENPDDRGALKRLSYRYSISLSVVEKIISDKANR